MRVVVFAVAVLSTTASAFAPRHCAVRRPPPTRTTLADSPDETVQTVEEVVDALEELQSVEEAIEVLEQHQQQVGDELGVEDGDENSQNVVLRQSKEELQLLQDIKNFSREDIAGDIQALMEENETDDIVGTIADFILSMMDETSQQVKEEPRTTEEAAVSASLYMNPATAKIASNLVVTWEPAVAEILDRMSRVCNPGRPFMVGVVG
jgi:hypothetical protein